jgi:hypothetical protein
MPRRKPVDQTRRRAIFLPVESFSPSADRWVTPDRPKRFSESDFDFAGGLVLTVGAVTAPHLNLVTRLEASGVMSLHWSPLLPAALLRSTWRRMYRQVKGPSGLANFLGGPF